MDLATVLDILARQVPAREISISGACARLEQHITSLNREDARSLRHCLPDLLKVLLGGPGYQGWIEIIGQNGGYGETEALIRLLQPKGVLFSAILSQIPDSGLFYEIPQEHFPAVSCKAIEMGRLEVLLSAVYEGRLTKSGDVHVLRLSTENRIVL